MAKRLLGIFALAALAVSLAGCGSPPTSRIDGRIVGNNAAGFQAEARKAMAFGELDIEAIIRISGKALPRREQTRTPDRPTAPQPIRPKPQYETGGTMAALGDSADPADADPITGQTREWLSKVDDVVALYPELAEQAAFLKETPKAQLAAVHQAFKTDLARLDPAAIADKEKAWRKAAPELRFQQFMAKFGGETRPAPMPE